MLELTQGSTRRILTCPACGSAALSVVQQKVRPVLGRAVWILDAACEDCQAPASWKWTRSVFLREVDRAEEE